MSTPGVHGYPAYGAKRGPKTPTKITVVRNVLICDIRFRNTDGVSEVDVFMDGMWVPAFRVANGEKVHSVVTARDLFNRREAITPAVGPR